MLKFALLAVLCFSLPTFADPISALTAYSGGGFDDGLFYFHAFGYLNDVPHTHISYTWSQAFVLPPSPVGDYLEVTRVNTYSTRGDIIIDGQVYGPVDDSDFFGLLSPDPNMYKEPQGPFGYSATTTMDLTGPIFVYVYGDFTYEFNPENCCQISVNAGSFQQFLQIERFHADGTPDPFPSAPEPASFALMGLAFLPVGWIVRRRSATP